MCFDGIAASTGLALPALYVKFERGYPNAPLPTKRTMYPHAAPA
jgi:hypothetical protein